jgi:hypothetical protein
MFERRIHPQPLHLHFGYSEGLSFSDHLRRAAPALLLAAAVLTFHARVLFSSGHTFPWDFRSHHLPLATAYADSLREGVAPLWEPYGYAGRPLLANPQTAVFYPGMFLAALPGREGLEERLEWLAVFHVVLAGWFAFLLGRRLGLGRAAGLLAALMFSLGAWPASQAEHLSCLLGTPWLVLSWLALFLTTRWRIPVLALAFALHWLVGFTAYTLMTAASALLLAAVLALLGRAPRRLPLEVLSAGGLALLLGAAQLLPTWELVRASVGQYRHEWLTGGGGMPLASLVSLVWPNRFGLFDLATFRSPFELTHLYLFSGWSGLALSLLALARLRDAVWRAIALTGVVCLALMLGEYTPFGLYLFRALPAILRNTVYWYLFFAPFLLALSLLAGRGADVWLQRDRWRYAAALLLATECVLVSSGRPMNTSAKASEPLFSSDALDGSADTLARIRAAAGDGRVDTFDDALSVMTGAPVMRLRTAGGYDPLALERVMQVRLRMARGERWGAYYQVEDPESPALDVLSVRALLTRRSLPAHSRWKLAAELPGHRVYVYPDAPARYRLVGEVRRATDIRPGVATAEDFELHGGSGGTVRVLDETRLRVALETESAGASYLVTSEAHYPGWFARIDGQPVAAHYTNIAFRGLPVPAGRHRIEFEFRSPMLAAGASISAAALLLWGGLVAYALRRRP